MCIGKNIDQDSFTFEDLCFTSNKEEETLGVTIQSILITLYERLVGYLDNDKRRPLFNSIIKVLFNSI